MTTQIRPEELRPWNWVEFNGEYRQVVKIDAENELKELGYVGSVSLKQSVKHPLPTSPWCAQLKPIPLSEDILLKAGFEKDGTGLSKPYGENSWIVFEDGVIKIVTRSENEMSTEILKHIKYLHQIQNGWHWLTGEELNISL